MGRPQNKRMVHAPPIHTRYAPKTAQGRQKKQIQLTLDEFEALRLADYVGMDQTQAARSMAISRSTFTRLIERARKKLAEFVVRGIPLTIEGGNIHFKNNVVICRACNYVQKTRIDRDIPCCPQCSSTDLLKLAEVFGHGFCCEEYQKN